MKKILLAISFFIPILCAAQDVVFPVDSGTKKIIYTEVVDVKASKDELYGKAIEWLSVYFKSGKDVLQFQDKDAGKVIAKFVVPIANSPGPVYVSLTILLKDDKYKYVFTDLYYTGGGGFAPWNLEEYPNAWKVGMTKKGINYVKTTTKANIENAILSLKLHMSKKSITDF